MMQSLLKTILLLALICFIQAPRCAAQDPFNGVGVTGIATKSAKPEFLRMTLTIVSKGSNTQAAIESIKDRKKKAAIKLEKLEANEDSINFSPINMGTQSGGPSIQQMKMMMRNNFGDSEAANKLMSVEPPVTVSVQVTADWKMPEGEEEDLLLAIQELKDRIIESDVAGIKEPDKLTAEQQELDAELSQSMDRYSSSDETKPGEPNFTFGRRFSPAEWDELMKQAFADAKAKAGKLAAAAAKELGPLSMLTSHDSFSEDYNPYSDYGPYGYNRSRSPQKTKDKEGVLTILSTDPKEVKLESTINAAFGLR